LTGPRLKVEKVKFRKRDLVPLHHYPSAPGEPSAARLRGPKKFQKGPPRKSALGTWLFRSVLALAALAVLGLGGLLILLSNGISSDRLSARAQATLDGLLGSKYQSSITATRIALDGERNLAIEADGVTLLDKTTGKAVGKLQSVKLGLKALPLLRGEINVTRVELANSELDLTLQTGAVVPDALAFMRNENGQLAGQLFVDEVFRRTASLVEFAAKGEGQKFALSNVLIRYGSADAPAKIRANVADIAHLGDGSLEISGFVTWLDMPYRVTGSIKNKDSFKYQIAEFPIVRGASPNASEPDGAPSEPRLKAVVKLALEGKSASGTRLLQHSMDLTDLTLNTGRNRLINGSANINIELRSDTQKLEISDSVVQFGANRTGFTGALTPDTAEGSRNYLFELVTTRASWDSAGTPEPAVDVSAQVRGVFDPSTKTAELSELGLRTLSGEIYGQGRLTFIGTSPRTDIALRIRKMSIAHAKQLWPINVAFGARSWVFDNVSGGAFTDSRIDFSVPESRFGGPTPGPLLTEKEIQANFNVSGARFDVMGDLPPVRDAAGTILVRGANTEIELTKGTTFLESGQTATVTDGRMVIPYVRGQTTMADLDVKVSGNAAAVAAIAAREPVNAFAKAPFTAKDLSGSVSADIKAKFPLKRAEAREKTTWSADITLKDVSIAADFDGQKLTDATGNLTATKAGLKLTADAKLNGIPATLKLDQPFAEGGKRDLSVQLELSEKARAAIVPGLNQFVKGPIFVDAQSAAGSRRQMKVDLGKASINLDFAGWTKGAGVPATASFIMTEKEGRTVLEDFDLSGESFSIKGAASLDKAGLASADLSRVRLVRGDNVTAKISRTKGGYSVKVNGEALDVRALVKKVTGSFDSAAKAVGSTGIAVQATIGSTRGFNGESMGGLQMSYSGRGSRVDQLQITAITDSGGEVSITNQNEGGTRSVQIKSGDAGSILRFFDYYDKMRGGSINIGLASDGDGPLRGAIDARNFTLVNEPRMKSLVGSRSSEGGPSLTQAVKKDIDVSTVKFSRGFAKIVKGRNSLELDDGILRSELVGLAFKGIAYDEEGRIGLSGTFMPAYGLNRIFGEIPILGEILGNGQDRGLIGITFKLTGAAKKPQLTVNPISVIAPGIFRQIFEFQ
jgi:hypothetical protein